MGNLWQGQVPPLSVPGLGVGSSEQEPPSIPPGRELCCGPACTFASKGNCHPLLEAETVVENSPNPVTVENGVMLGNLYHVSLPQQRETHIPLGFLTAE